MQEFSLEHPISLGDKVYRIRCVMDVEALFDELVSRSAKHPDVADERIPYWAELWPSAVGLSNWIVANRSLFEAKTVLEIGCGLGLPGIVAADHSTRVRMTDYMPEPLEWASANWRLNRSDEPDVHLLDWRSADSTYASDILLASDVAYERRMFEPLMRALQNLLLPGGFAVIAEPNRRLAKEFVNGFVAGGFSHEFTIINVTWLDLEYRIGIHVLRKTK
ncbi:MAG: class I SAM-dependent methyltransferase [Bacteroidota bacterium]